MFEKFGTLRDYVRPEWKPSKPDALIALVDFLHADLSRHVEAQKLACAQPEFERNLTGMCRAIPESVYFRLELICCLVHNRNISADCRLDSIWLH